MRFVRLVIVVWSALLWFSLAAIQPVVAVVVLMVILAWRDRERRVRRFRPP